VLEAALAGLPELGAPPAPPPPGRAAAVKSAQAQRHAGPSAHVGMIPTKRPSLKQIREIWGNSASSRISYNSLGGFNI